MNQQNIQEMLSYSKYIKTLIALTDKKVKNLAAITSFGCNFNIFTLVEKIFEQTMIKRKLLRQQEFIEIMLKDNCGQYDDIIRRILVNHEPIDYVSEITNRPKRIIRNVIRIFNKRCLEYMKPFSDDWYEKNFKTGHF